MLDLATAIVILDLEECVVELVDMLVDRGQASLDLGDPFRRDVGRRRLQQALPDEAVLGGVAMQDLGPALRLLQPLRLIGEDAIGELAQQRPIGEGAMLGEEVRHQRAAGF